MRTHARRELLVDRFGYRVRQWLNIGAERLSDRTLQRLSAARARALSRMRTADAPSWGDLPHRPTPLPRQEWRFPRLAFALAAFVVAAGLFGMNEWHDQSRIAELAELDTAILADELPFTAHLDPNYKTLLTRAQ